LNSLKHHWKPKESLSYVFGNFSPLCRKKDLEDRDYQALFLADAIIHNHKKIKQFNFRHPDARLWIKGKENMANEICALVERYFNELKEGMLYVQK